MDFQRLKELIKLKDSKLLKAFMNENDLVLDHGKIKVRDKDHARYYEDFWHQRQQARKHFAA